MIERITLIETELSHFAIEQAELIHKLTPDHPKYQKVWANWKESEKKIETLEKGQIETNAVMDLLPALKITGAQGYLIGKPEF